MEIKNKKAWLQLLLIHRLYWIKQETSKVLEVPLEINKECFINIDVAAVCVQYLKPEQGMN